jgi:ABC-2 type transport system permease protein
MVTLPVAFLSLVPAGTVGTGLYDVIKVITAIFPFKPALEAMTAALEAGNGSLGGPLLHLAILAVAYAILARVALRRFARV